MQLCNRTLTMHMEMNDDTPVTAKELAQIMRMGVSTIHKYKCMGYEMEFGIRTTAGHFKLWLREFYQKKREAERVYLKEALHRLT
jgi:hypothetical protein